MARNPALPCLLSWLLSSLPCTVQGQNYRQLGSPLNLPLFQRILVPHSPAAHFSRCAGVCLEAPPPLPSTHHATGCMDKAPRQVGSLNGTPGPWRHWLQWQLWTLSTRCFSACLSLALSGTVSAVSDCTVAHTEPRPAQDQLQCI